MTQNKFRESALERQTLLSSTVAVSKREKLNVVLFFRPVELLDWNYMFKFSPCDFSSVSKSIKNFDLKKMHTVV